MYVLGQIPKNLTSPHSGDSGLRHKHNSRNGTIRERAIELLVRVKC